MERYSTFCVMGEGALMENTYAEKTMPSHMNWHKEIMIRGYCLVLVQK